MDQPDPGETQEPPSTNGAADGSNPSASSIESELLQDQAAPSIDVENLRAQASAVLDVEAISQTANIDDVVPMKRMVEHTLQEQMLSSAARPQRSGRASPLKLQTNSETAPQPVETISNSPTLRKHVIPVAEGTVGTLPAFQPASPIKERFAGSPQSEKLPSFRQVTGQIAGQLSELAEFAELAAQRDLRSSHQNNQSAGSAASPSSMIPLHHPYPTSSQTSPSGYYDFSARSPTSTVSEHPQYGSPPQYPSTAYFTNRRSSASTGNSMPHPPSLPSASSSGESLSTHASSSTDGYSTAHTTPIDAGSLAEGTPRPMPILPPPPGMPQSAMVLPPGFKCGYPGCIAPPFQTQYLLRYVIC